jgi:hypothetical protein
MGDAANKSSPTNLGPRDQIFGLEDWEAGEELEG